MDGRMDGRGRMMKGGHPLNESDAFLCVASHDDHLEFDAKTAAVSYLCMIQLSSDNALHLGGMHM